MARQRVGAGEDNAGRFFRASARFEIVVDEGCFLELWRSSKERNTVIKIGVEVPSQTAELDVREAAEKRMERVNPVDETVRHLIQACQGLFAQNFLHHGVPNVAKRVSGDFFFFKIVDRAAQALLVGAFAGARIVSDMDRRDTRHKFLKLYTTNHGLTSKDVRWIILSYQKEL